MAKPQVLPSRRKYLLGSFTVNDTVLQEKPQGGKKLTYS